MNDVIEQTRCWLERVVIGLDLCPFAARELKANRIRFAVTEARTDEALVRDLLSELQHLLEEDRIETTLLIHPHVLNEFGRYNDFLDVAEELLVESGLEGVVQIASFHPLYQFAGTQRDDAQNYSNRSPYPMIHLLREDSVEQAVENHPDVSSIPERNVRFLEDLGTQKILELLESCQPLGPGPDDSKT